MKKNPITPDQATAILEHGTPFGAGGNIIQVKGISERTEQPLFSECITEAGGRVGDPHCAIEAPFIDDLMGGLDHKTLKTGGDRTVSSIKSEHCYTAEGDRSPIRQVTVSFSKAKLEAIQKTAAMSAAGA